jgi:hypothetical protein
VEFIKKMNNEEKNKQISKLKEQIKKIENNNKHNDLYKQYNKVKTEWGRNDIKVLHNFINNDLKVAELESQIEIIEKKYSNYKYNDYWEPPRIYNNTYLFYDFLNNPVTKINNSDFYCECSCSRYDDTTYKEWLDRFKEPTHNALTLSNGWPKEIKTPKIEDTSDLWMKMSRYT